MHEEGEEGMMERWGGERERERKKKKKGREKKGRGHFGGSEFRVEREKILLLLSRQRVCWSVWERGRIILNYNYLYNIFYNYLEEIYK